MSSKIVKTFFVGYFACLFIGEALDSLSYSISWIVVLGITVFCAVYLIRMES